MSDLAEVLIGSAIGTGTVLFISFVIIAAVELNDKRKARKESHVLGLSFANLNDDIMLTYLELSPEAQEMMREDFS